MARQSRLEVKGQRDVSRRLRTLATDNPRRVERVLWRFGNRVMTRSKDEFVPVDLGPLRKSGMVHHPVWVGRALSITLSYGDDAAPYALAIHEHPSDYSPPSWIAAEQAGNTVQFQPAGRGPKYLERPLLEESNNMLAFIAAELK